MRYIIYITNVLHIDIHCPALQSHLTPMTSARLSMAQGRESDMVSQLHSRAPASPALENLVSRPSTILCQAALSEKSALSGYLEFITHSNDNLV